MHARRFAPILGLILLIIGGVYSCGQANQTAQDCTQNQYYDSANSVCTACPSITRPTCEPGCGYQIVNDARGCPMAQCVAGCVCPQGDYFSDSTLDCQQCPGPPGTETVCGGATADAGSPDTSGPDAGDVSAGAGDAASHDATRSDSGTGDVTNSDAPAMDASPADTSADVAGSDAGDAATADGQ